MRRMELLHESSVLRELSGFNFSLIWMQPAFHRNSKLIYQTLLHIKLLSDHCVTFNHNFSGNIINIIKEVQQ